MAAETTSNYGWTKIDPDANVNVARDVNTPLDEIDASIKKIVENTVNTFPNIGLTTKQELAGSIDSPMELYIVIADPAVNTEDSDKNYTAWTENYSRFAGTTEEPIVVGTYSHTEGLHTAASGSGAHAEGYNTRASDIYSHAEGSNAVASGPTSHAEGSNAVASGSISHAEGNNTVASGPTSHAEGSDAVAIGVISHAEGINTLTYGNYSHAEGSNTTAKHRSEHVGGEYNIIEDDTNTPELRGNYQEIIGNGTSDTARSNARTLTWEGTQWTAGDVTCDAVQGNHDNLYSLRAIGAVVASTPNFDFGQSNSVSVSANSHTTVDISFGSTKTEIPLVFASIQHATAGLNLIATVQSVTNAQASICVTNLGSTDVSNITVDWLAISGR